MTQSFYCKFLEFLSSKEKNMLLGQIEKRKIKVKGFRSIKDAPSELLATYFAKNEKTIFKILSECYTPKYSGVEDAIRDFLPGSAVVSFAYLIHENDVDL